MMSILFCIALLITTTPKDAVTFVLDTGSCLTLPPCTCSTHGVFENCDSNNLTTFPALQDSSETRTHIQFDFSDNHLTTIPTNAFRNLHRAVSKSTNITLLLQNNQLHSIADGAFRGIADNIIYLQLDDNKFTAIPTELRYLPRLDSLHLQDNPLASLSPHTLLNLGRSLTNLRVDLKPFNYWPSQLNSLTSLTGLYVRYVNTARLYRAAFDGFARTLDILSITKSMLDSVPPSISNLLSLRELHLQDNKITSIVDSDFRNLTRLEYLDLSMNPIESISQHAFDGNNGLQSLSLGLTRIHQLPVSVTGLDRLVLFDLPGYSIECNCSLSDLKSWNVTDILMAGECKNGRLQVKSYLLGDLQNCP